LAKYFSSTDTALLVFCMAYLTFAVGAGLSELAQRVSMKRFTSRTIHDMRGAAVTIAVRKDSKTRQRELGDLIARIIGDTARIKSGMSGILVHVLRNGLLLVGACLLLIIVSWELGVLFVAGALLSMMIGYRTAAVVEDIAGKQRQREADYAMAMQAGLEIGALQTADEQINQDSSRDDVRTTQIIARSAVLVHAVMALAVSLALWVGARQVANGVLVPGALFLFIAYALMLHRRMVQVGRQIARTGKVVACVQRVHDLAQGGTVNESGNAAAPLTDKIECAGVRLKSTHGKGAPPRIKNLDLTIAAGTRVLILGKSGSGKSSLLRLLAGAETPKRGTITWDGHEMTGGNGAPPPDVGYLEQDPVFPHRRTWQILGVAESADDVDEINRATLEELGVWKRIQKFPKGLRTKIASGTLSRLERRRFALSGVIVGNESLWLLDEPFEGLSKSKADKLLNVIESRRGDRTLIVTSARPTCVDAFDKIVTLRKGRVAFEGTPQQWREVQCKP
jgi:ABC-type bacteriocin/lantibiotic exporter with double-glycine peptidase domain